MDKALPRASSNPKSIHSFSTPPPPRSSSSPSDAPPPVGPRQPDHRTPAPGRRPPGAPVAGVPATPRQAAARRAPDVARASRGSSSRPAPGPARPRSSDRAKPGRSSPCAAAAPGCAALGSRAPCCRSALRTPSVLPVLHLIYSSRTTPPLLQSRKHGQRRRRQIHLRRFMPSTFSALSRP